MQRPASHGTERVVPSAYVRPSCTQLFTPDVPVAALNVKEGGGTTGAPTRLRSTSVTAVPAI
ncbi:hypothetical protein HY413_00715 [Candidatus Kaiserbacteria bacterium]|nr:hypothetical protein [Candidatus Kaiserbacteria bacterium]